MTKKFTFTTALLFLSIIMLSQSLSLNKQQFAKGEEIIVKFTALSSYATNAWIGILPTEVAHGSEAECDKYELSYQYISGKTSGELKFKAPEKEGIVLPTEAQVKEWLKEAEENKMSLEDAKQIYLSAQSLDFDKWVLFITEML